jgi:DNA-binding PadR family transcriptional regulator
MLGELEQVVMLALLRVGPEAYGVPVRDEIARCTGRDLTLGTVYKTLTRLEEKGFVGSWTGEPTPQRGGRRKKYYKATGAGRVAVRQSLESLRTLTAGLDLGLKAP